MRLFRRKIPVLTAILFSLIYGLSACAWYHLARAAALQSKEESITLTATTTLLADLARQIGSGSVAKPVPALKSCPRRELPFILLPKK